MSKSDSIREVLREASGPLSVSDVNAAAGFDESDEASTAALLAYLQKAGEARNVAPASKPGQWVAGTAKAAKRLPPPKSAARATKEVAPVVVAPLPAAAITPPGSTALADDGSILILEGDRVAARLSQQQALNIAALVARHTAR